jgi:hypothetical protein
MIFFCSFFFFFHPVTVAHAAQVPAPICHYALDVRVPSFLTADLISGAWRAGNAVL